MISLDNALEILLDSAVLQGSEPIAFQDTLHRVLAQDVMADMDMPPFDKSAVDGYACRTEDIKNELEVVEVIAAGQRGNERLDGEFVKVQSELDKYLQVLMN